VIINPRRVREFAKSIGQWLRPTISTRGCWRFTTSGFSLWSESFPTRRTSGCADYGLGAKSLAEMLLWTLEGWLYVAVILDLFWRWVVGWALNQRLERKLALEAMHMALAQRHPAQGLLHHSDRGRLSASREYQQVLAHYGIRSSVSRNVR
jgi:hypothetical protein